jgi:hypothetical protein
LGAKIPPPCPALLPEIVLLITVTMPLLKLAMPPPPPAPPPEEAMLLAASPEKVLLKTVSVP